MTAAVTLAKLTPGPRPQAPPNPLAASRASGYSPAGSLLPLGLGFVCEIRGRCPSFMGLRYTLPQEYVSLGYEQQRGGSGNRTRGLIGTRQAGTPAKRKPSRSVRSGSAPRQQDRRVAQCKVPEWRGSHPARPPRRLTQKFPLNSEPVMAGALAGAEDSGAETDRAGRPGVTVRSPAAPVWSLSAGGEVRPVLSHAPGSAPRPAGTRSPDPD